MTYIQEVVADLELVKRLLAVMTFDDQNTKEGGMLYNQLKRREEKYERLIKAYKWEPTVGRTFHVRDCK